MPAAASIAQALNTGNSGYYTGAGQFSISTSGSLIYAAGGILPDLQNSLVWVDHEGKADPIPSLKAPIFPPRLSPDGQQIAYTTVALEKHVWVYDLNRGTATPLTSEGLPIFVAWSRDGRRVVFDWHKTGDSNIYCQTADGSSPMERLTHSQCAESPGSRSPDGETLAFVQANPETDYDILLLNLRDRRVTPFMNSRFFEGYPEFSPDGKWWRGLSPSARRW